MKKKIRTVIIDDNEAVTSSVKKYFWNNAVIEVVGSYADGKAALDYLVNNYNYYDLIIIDILLPQVDGIKILDTLQRKGINKKVIIISSYKDDYTIRLAHSLGVDYYMLKPFNMNSLEDRILDISRGTSLRKKLDMQNVELEVSNILHDLGIPSHIRGYQYIRDGIMIMYDNPMRITMITKEIYPELAERYDTTITRVERAIRHAIEISWVRGDLKVMESLFGHSIDVERSKPTNSEFLTTIADHIKINYKVLIG